MTQPSTDVVTPETYSTGLEDLTQADLTIPRLRMSHKQGVFVDSNAGLQMGKLTTVILGLVRQRVLFHWDVEDDDKPMCKSFNFSAGWPNLDNKTTKLAFPWQAAGFNQADFPLDQEGLVALPCDGCKLKDWGSHPASQGGRDKPYCAEQFTLAIYYGESVEGLQKGEYSSALITYQKTSLNPLKKYLSQFQSRGVGAYTAFTEMGLDMRKRGSTDYCVANFKNLGPTDVADHPEYSENYNAIRMFLTEARPQPRIRPEDGPDVSVGVSGVAPAQSVPVATRPPLGKPVQAAEQPADPNIVEAQIVASASVDDTDDLPF